MTTLFDLDASVAEHFPAHSAPAIAAHIRELVDGAPPVTAQAAETIRRLVAKRDTRKAA